VFDWLVSLKTMRDLGFAWWLPLFSIADVKEMLQLCPNLQTVFAKTSPKRSFSVIENEPLGLVFAKTGFINAGTGQYWCFLVSLHLLMLQKVAVQSLVK
jgi:hypothetical protein